MENRESYFWKVLTKQPLIVFGGIFNVEPKDFLDLKVGDKITQIGDGSKGGMAVLNRQENFLPYITYVGMRKEAMHVGSTEENEVLLFEVREEDRPIGFPEDEQFCIAYIILLNEDKYELKTMDPEKNVINIYQPIFKRYETDGSTEEKSDSRLHENEGATAGDNDGG